MGSQLFVQNREKWNAINDVSYALGENAKVTCVKNGYILPTKNIKKAGVLDYLTKGGVCNSKHQFVAGWTRNLSEEMNKSCLSTYEFDESEAEIVHERVVFGGILDGQFGHFFAEGLSRLWWVCDHQDEFDHCVFAHTTQTKGWFQDFFSLLGIPEEKIIYTDSITKYDEIIVPDETMYLWSGFREELNIVYNKIISNLPKSSSEKVYFTRTKFEKQDCVNEEYYENYFRQHGYEIVSPEKLSIVEQLAYVAGAKCIGCVCGSLTHLALFARPETELIVLCRATDHYFKPQLIINEARRVKGVFIDATHNYLPVKHNRGCYLLEPTKEWNDYLESIGEERVEISEEDKKNNLYKFMKAWRDTYLRPAALSTISDFDICDVLDYVDRAFGGDGIARKTYKFGEHRSTMLKKIEKYEDERDVIIKQNDAKSLEKMKALENENEALRKELSLMRSSLRHKIKEKLVRKMVRRKSNNKTE